VYTHLLTRPRMSRENVSLSGIYGTGGRKA